MSNFNRRDFLLHLAPLGAASTILLAGEEAFAQIKQIRLQTPKENQSFAVGEQVQIIVLLKTQYPRLLRVDFRANGQLIGSGTWRNSRITWTPTQTGNYTITAEAISMQGNVISTATTNVSILTVLYDKLGVPGNWGFNENSNTHRLLYEELDEANEFQVSTLFNDNLNISGTVILKKIEFAAAYYVNSTGQNLPISNLVNCKLKIWDTANGSFFGNAIVPSLTNLLPGPFVDVQPIAVFGPTTVFKVGWNNLSINLPSNRRIEISVQCPVNTSTENIFATPESFIGPHTFTRFASRAFGGGQSNLEVTGVSSSVKLYGVIQ